MKIFIIITYSLLLLLNPNSAISNNNIVFIDTDKILASSKPGTFLLKQLNELNQKNIESFKKIETSLKKRDKEITSQKNILSVVEFKKKIDQLKLDVESYNNNRQTLISDFTQLKDKSTSDFFKSVNSILIKYSDENSISLIIRKKSLVIGKSELDVTNKIIQLINDNIKEVNIK